MFMWDWFTGMLNYLGKFEIKFGEQNVDTSNVLSLIVSDYVATCKLIGNH